MKGNFEEGKLVLTPSALLTFLSQIDELDDGGRLAVSEGDGSIEVSIGSSVYILESPKDSEVTIDREAANEIQEINSEGYDTFEEEIAELDVESVEGGIIKELAKTLLIGGLVRLTKDAILKS